MSVSQVTNSTNYESNVSQVSKTQRTEVKKAADAPAAVYEKTAEEPVKKTYKQDRATVDRMLEDIQKSSDSLRTLVEKLLVKQGQTVSAATDIYALLREGKVTVDPETKAQAQKDIAEDGYWGVKQTSDRMVSFAKALTGGDPSKADKMIKAVQKGFDQAAKAWGGELPGITKETVERTIKELEAWRDSAQAVNE